MADEEFLMMRFALFALISALFGACDYREGMHHRYGYYVLDHRYNYHRQREIPSSRLFGAAVLLAILSITELAIDNYNEWFGFKILGYLFVWLVIIGFKRSLDLAFIRDAMQHAIIALAILVFCATTAMAIYATQHQPLTQRVDREVLSRYDLIAAGDSYTISGSGSGDLLTGAFVVSEYGSYRYYYADENGGIHQNIVSASGVTIYYAADGEAPCLEQLCSYDRVTRHRNRHEVISRENEVVWYELRIPAGSLIEGYRFDLN